MDYAFYVNENFCQVYDQTKDSEVLNFVEAEYWPAIFAEAKAYNEPLFLAENQVPSNLIKILTIYNRIGGKAR